ncbi:MAG: major capsid protein, partial [Steroidobacteraceae bacterium]
MATLRSDVIVPEVFTAYVDEAVTTRSAFINSGVIQPLAILNATEGGDYVNVPSWTANLTGDAEVLSDTSSLTPGKIGAEKQVCPVLHRGRAWEVRTLAALAAGDDPMAAIGRKVADYISHQQQKDVFAILKGIFGPLTSNTTGALKDLAIDSNATAGVLSPGKVAEARAALGDQGEKLSVIAMHSKVYYDLVERRAIEYVTAGEARQTADSSMPDAFAGNLANAYGDVTVPVYMGMRVLVSDDVNNDGTNYASYLFTPG